MTKRSAPFGRLLKAGISSIAHIEGKTAPVIEEQLGMQIGVAGYTIQRYKAGHIPTESRSVQILATACVQRGLLGRTWLERFLNITQFPASEHLIQQLCPLPQATQFASRTYANLPAPPYIQFVPRDEIIAEIAEGLQQRSPVVLITGFGGTGKTSLAHEVATRCLRNDSSIPTFDAVVWISDADHHGTTNLSVVLDEVARTLDYPGFIQYDYDEKRRAVEQLLKRQRVLLVVDNLETIGDAALLEWLAHLPEPSKALVTSREQQRVLRNSWLVEIDGMREHEAHALIAHRLRALRLDRLVGELAAFTPLIMLTDGNPKAIELALGLIKHERRTIEDLVDDLHTAQGTLFDDLLARSWALLERAAQHIVMALTFFPGNASVSAIQATASVDGQVFDRAVERLADLSLINAQHGDLYSLPRYALHPLVRAFATAQLRTQPGLEIDMREHWMRWCVAFANQVGFCWYDLSRLALLDSEHEAIHVAINWAFAHQRYVETIQLIEGISYYYNVRGLSDDHLGINLMRAEAAHQIGDIHNEILALAYHVEIRSKQGIPDEIVPLLGRLHDLVQDTHLSDDIRFELQHAQALYTQAQGDLEAAEQIWRELLPLAARLGGHPYVINRRWLATCLVRQRNIAEARQLYRESLDDARLINDSRSVAGNMLKLAAMDLDEGNFSAAETALQTCFAMVQQHQDRRRLGEIHRLSGTLYYRQNDMPKAQAALIEAINLFEHLGMRHELLEAHDALQQIDMNWSVGQF